MQALEKIEELTQEVTLLKASGGVPSTSTKSEEGGLK
jgi:hypothetical protein